MPTQPASTLKRLALASIGVALLVMGLKYAAYVVTGSVALLSDALESIVNLITAVIAWWAIHVSFKPADRDHPFGHHKAEYFSAVVEGVLIVLAALLIFREAWQAYLAPRMLATPALGMAINAGATAINLGWAMLLLRTGRRRRSPALEADGRHILTDVITSVGVIFGLALATVTGWLFLDPLMAALVALNILREGWLVVSKSLSGLMDQAMDADEQDRVREAISANAEGALEVHDLKTRTAGRAIFIEFHLVVPEEMSVGAAHDICDRIEDALRRLFEGARISIHVEPEGEAKRTGVPVL